jgi:hypothetical protein
MSVNDGPATSRQGFSADMADKVFRYALHAASSAKLCP